MKQNVNLTNIIPKQYKDLLSIRTIFRISIVILILLGFISMAKFFSIQELNVKYEDYLIEKKGTQAEISYLKAKHPKIEKDTSLEVEKKQLEEYVKASKQLIYELQSIEFGNKNGLGIYLKEFALKKAELTNVWLTNINIQRGGAYILLEGNTTDIGDVKKYMNNLSESAVFAEYEIVLKNIKTAVSSNNYDNFIIMLKNQHIDEELLQGK